MKKKSSKSNYPPGLQKDWKKWKWTRFEFNCHTIICPSASEWVWVLQYFIISTRAEASQSASRNRSSASPRGRKKMQPLQQHKERVWIALFTQSPIRTTCPERGCSAIELISIQEKKRRAPTGGESWVVIKVTLKIKLWSIHWLFLGSPHPHDGGNQIVRAAVPCANALDSFRAP